MAWQCFDKIRNANSNSRQTLLLCSLTTHCLHHQTTSACSLKECTTRFTSKQHCLSISVPLVIVGTWVVLLKGYSKRLSNTYLKLFFRDIFLKTEAHSLALASQSKALKLKLLYSLQSSISYKIRHVHVNTMMASFPFLPEGVLLFIFPPLKLLTLKHRNQIYVNKRNSCMA